MGKISKELRRERRQGDAPTQGITQVDPFTAHKLLSRGGKRDGDKIILKGRIYVVKSL